MNAMHISGATDQTMLWAINVAIHATFISSLALGIAGFLRRRAAIRYWVLCSGLVLVLASPVIGALVQRSGHSLLVLDTSRVATAPQPHAPRMIEIAPPPTSPSTSTDFLPEDDSVSISHVPPAPKAAMEISGRPDVTHDSEPVTIQPYRFIDVPRFGILLLGIVWAIGSAILLLRMVIGWLRMRRILQMAEPIQNPQLQDAFCRAYRGASDLAASQRMPLLVASDRVSGPLAAGLFRARVVLPSSLVGRIGANDLENVLVHEIAHIVRHDQMIVLLQNLAAALYWTHPLVRILNRQLAKAREEVCDNFVLAVADAPAYGRTLLFLAEIVQQRKAVLGSVGFFTSNWKLEERVAGLLDVDRDRSTLLSRRHSLFLAAVVIAVTAVTSAATFTIATASEERGTPEESDTDDMLGSVYGPDGNPIAAQIWMGGPPRSAGWSRTPLPVEWTKVAMSDQSGSFRIPRPILERFMTEDPAESLAVRIVATAPGHGHAWADISVGRLTESIQFHLVNDVSVRGRLVTPEGNPIQGVEVSVVDITAPPNLPDSETLLRTGHRGSGIYTNWPAWMGGSPIHQPVMTDVDGRFELQGVGSERYLRLQARGSAIGATRLSIITRKTPANVPSGLIATRTGLAESKYFADFTHVASRGRTVQGRILDGANDQPIPNVHVVIPTSWESRIDPSITDGSGEFSMHGVPADRQYQLELTPPSGSGYYRSEVLIEESPQQEAVFANLRLTRAKHMLRGRVIDETTGQGVAATIEYNALFPNANVDDLGNDPVANPLATASADADGAFAIPVLPGLGAIGVRTESALFAPAFVDPEEAKAHFEGTAMEAVPSSPGQYTYFPTAAGGDRRGLMGVTHYRSFTLLNIDDESALVPLNLSLKPLSEQPGAIFDMEGNPLAGVEVIGLGPEWTSSTREPLPTHEFTVMGLHPGQSRILLFLDRTRSLGASITVEGERDFPVHVTMRPTGHIKGRFVDSLGNPLTTVELEELVPEKLGLIGAFWWIPKMGEDGTFECRDLIDGVSYELLARTPEHTSPVPVATNIKAVPGRTTDIGTFRVNDDGSFEAVGTSALSDGDRGSHQLE